MGNAKMKASGVSLAMAIAGLVGCAANTPGHSDGAMPAASASAGTTDLMHCYSANVCNGHNDCKTASNACAGHASCKGEGFVAMPAKACGDIGGEKKDAWVGEVSTADLIHCSGVNVCKGHNDCKTASNACAGHGSCKGQGFVAVPAKACGDIGGKIDG